MMNKILLIVPFAIGLMASPWVYAGVEQPTDFISNIDVQSALAITRQMIITEAVPNVCIFSPFTRVRGIEVFGVDEIGTDSILRDQLKNLIFTGQNN